MHKETNTKSNKMLAQIMLSRRSFGLLALRLGGDEEDVDVGENTTGGDGCAAEKSVEFLVVSDGQLNVAGDDSGLLVVLGGVSSKFEDLSGEVLKNGSEVHWGTGANSFGVAASLQEAGNTTNWELKTSL